MNRKIVMIAAGFVLGAFATLGVISVTVPPPANAQAISPLAAARLNALEKRVAILENQAAKGNQVSTTGGQLHSGTSSATTSAATQGAQINEVVVLQQQVNTLQVQLQKLQSQFANHYHTWTTTTDGGPGRAVMTILNCQGYGKPCTSATSLNEVTVLTPSNVPPGPPQTYTTKTSGPVTGPNNQ
jgi:hypothetical protein